MSVTQRIAWETMRTFNSATLNGSYQTLGTALLFPSYICKIVNTSSVSVTISTDGINDMDVAPAGSYWLYDEGKVGLSSQQPALPAGTQILIKGSAGTGTIYLVSQYVIQR